MTTSAPKPVASTSRRHVTLTYKLINLTRRSTDVKPFRYECAFIQIIKDNSWAPTDYIIGIPNIKTVHVKRLNAPKINSIYPQYSLSSIERHAVNSLADENHPPLPESDQESIDTPLYGSPTSSPETVQSLSETP